VNGTVAMPRRYALRDNQWERVKDLLPGSAHWVGRTAKDNRLFVEAVLYRYRAFLFLWGSWKGNLFPFQSESLYLRSRPKGLE